MVYTALKQKFLVDSPFIHQKLDPITLRFSK